MFEKFCKILALALSISKKIQNMIRATVKGLSLYRRRFSQFKSLRGHSIILSRASIKGEFGRYFLIPHLYFLHWHQPFPRSSVFPPLTPTVFPPLTPTISSLRHGTCTFRHFLKLTIKSLLSTCNFLWKKWYKKMLRWRAKIISVPRFILVA